MSFTEPKTITLRTADGKLFRAEESVAMEFGTVKTFIEEGADAAANVYPLPNVTAKYFSLIIQYVKKQLKFKEESAANGESEYDAEFVAKLSNDDLKEMLLAVNYLNIKALMDVLTQETADRIENKSVEYVRSFFGIENDFTPEEEAKIRGENPWAYENVDI